MADQTLVQGAGLVAQTEGAGKLAAAQGATKVAAHLAEGISTVVQKRNREFNAIVKATLAKTEGMDDETYKKLSKALERKRGGYVYLNKKERLLSERDLLKFADNIKKEKIAKNTIAKLQGTSADAIGAGYAAGQAGGQSSTAFSKAISGKEDAIKIAEDANESFNKMKKDKQVEFMNAKDKLKLDQTKINANKIQSELTSLIDSKYFNNFTDLSKNSEQLLNNMMDEIAIWQKNPALHNAKGLDMLKRKISDMYPLNPKSRGEQNIVIEVQDIIKNEIINQVPEYAKVMEAYETASKLEKTLINELSLGKKNASTTLKKNYKVFYEIM